MVSIEIINSPNQNFLFFGSKGNKIQIAFFSFLVINER